MNYLDNLNSWADLLNPPFNAGATIYSMSWGGEDTSGYDSSAQDFDNWVWNKGGTSHRKMALYAAAGNEGDTKPDTTVGSPATAKSVMAVGASNMPYVSVEQVIRTTNFATVSAEVATNLGVDPKTFNCCDNKWSLNTRAQCCESVMWSLYQSNSFTWAETDLADFSSRGPTADGRLKPDFVAPGNYIISSRAIGMSYISRANDTCAISDRAALLPMAGTSMATPTAAGNAALVRQYLVEGFYSGGYKGSDTKLTGTSVFAAPTGALLHALLINSAVSLSGQVDVDWSGKNMISLADGIYPPNKYQGHGRILLSNVLWFNDSASASPWRLYAEDDRIGINNGGSSVICFTIRNATTISNTDSRIAIPIKATLVWHDYPGDLTSGVVLVNNLDLFVQVKGSQSSRLFGNTKSNTVRDSLNPVETVIFPEAHNGDTIQVIVAGSTVVKGPQFYSLVVTGPFQPSDILLDAACGDAGSDVINGGGSTGPGNAAGASTLYTTTQKHIILMYLTLMLLTILITYQGI